MWPFRKRVRGDEAADALAKFYCCNSTYICRGNCGDKCPPIYYATRDCLRMMLGREPTDEEIRRAYEIDHSLL